MPGPEAGAGMLKGSAWYKASGKRITFRMGSRSGILRADHVESFTLCSGLNLSLLALQKDHSGSIWKISEGKTEAGKQQQQRGQTLASLPDCASESPGELSGTPVAQSLSPP